MHQVALQQLFEKGRAPKNLDGFYAGKLDALIAGNFFESVAGLVLKFWLPWYGKRFNEKKNTGDNLIPGYMASFLVSKFGEKTILEKEGGNIHVFPFATKITKGLKDDIQVLQLNYDLPENPEKVRKVIDELVEVEKNYFLGKAYIKEENKDFRLVAFFSLYLKR